MNTPRGMIAAPQLWTVRALAVLVGLIILAACQLGDVQLVHETVDQPLGTATRADVTIALGVGRLLMGALEEPDILVRGDISYPTRSQVVRQAAVEGDGARFSLREDDTRRTVLAGDVVPVWDLRLNRVTPLTLRVETGVGENTLDLAQLQVREFDLRSGVGETKVLLPRSAGMRAVISGGVGETTVVVPADIPVRVESSVGIGGITVPASYRRQGDAYVSPEFDLAAGRIELAVSGGIGAITIVQEEE